MDLVVKNYCGKRCIQFPVLAILRSVVPWHLVRFIMSCSWSLQSNSRTSITPKNEAPPPISLSPSSLTTSHLSVDRPGRGVSTSVDSEILRSYASLACPVPGGSTAPLRITVFKSKWMFLGKLVKLTGYSQKGVGSGGLGSQVMSLASRGKGQAGPQRKKGLSRLQVQDSFAACPA